MDDFEKCLHAVSKKSQFALAIAPLILRPSMGRHDLVELATVRNLDGMLKHTIKFGSS